MKGVVKTIGGSIFLKLPKEKARELNLIDGTTLEIKIKKESADFLWNKGKNRRNSAEEFKKQLKKEKFWS